MAYLSPKRIAYGNDEDGVREALKRGVDKLANAVKVTLGPRGRNVLLAPKYATPVSTKDGVTVAQNIALEDDVENAGALMVAEAASRTADACGDGTTSVTILVQAIFREGVKNIAAGANPMEIKKGIELAARATLDYIVSITREVGPGDVHRIGTISANGDEEIGGLIAQAVEQVGKDGVIAIEESHGLKTVLEVVEGMEFDRGWVSPYFVTDPERMDAQLDNPYVLITDMRVEWWKDIKNIMEAVRAAGRPLLVIADDVLGEGLHTLIQNKVRGNMSSCAILCPGFGDRRRALLEDIAVLTGGTVISAELGTGLKSVKLEQLGQVRKVIVTQGTTTFIAELDEERKEAVASRVATIRAGLEAADGAYDKERFRERLSKLAGGVAIIKVGAATESELREKKFRVEDAMHATRGAVAEGIVPGGGMALLRASQRLNDLWQLRRGGGDPSKHGVGREVPISKDMGVGYEILCGALEAPFRQIIENGGGKPDVVMGKLEGSAVEMGYDAAAEEIVDMYERGVIDPARVVKQCVMNASSIAALLLTTEAVVTEIDEQSDQAGLTTRQVATVKGTLENMRRRRR